MELAVGFALPMQECCCAHTVTLFLPGPNADPNARTASSQTRLRLGEQSIHWPCAADPSHGGVGALCAACPASFHVFPRHYRSFSPIEDLHGGISAIVDDGQARLPYIHLPTRPPLDFQLPRPVAVLVAQYQRKWQNRQNRLPIPRQRVALTTKRTSRRSRPMKGVIKISTSTSRVTMVPTYWTRISCMIQT